MSEGVRMQVEAVLFDLFDTILLVENDENWYVPSLMKLHRFLVEHGINVVFEEFKKVYFDVRTELYANTEANLEEPHFNVRISETLRRLGHDLGASDRVVIGASAVFAREFNRCVHLDDEAPRVLQKLGARYRLGLVSNLALPECARTLLDKFDLKKFFEVILLSGEVNRRKPSPEIFAMALKALNVAPSKTVFVGDTPNSDIKGAKNSGLKAILIQRKHSEKIPEVRPDKTIMSLSELPAILEDC
jgi:FMN phosphatase YigB (HAD superfamily)